MVIWKQRCLRCMVFTDLSQVKTALEAELQKCNSSCRESLEKYVANMSTNADFQQVSDISYRDRYRHVMSCTCYAENMFKGMTSSYSYFDCHFFLRKL
jgi:hypothetical protein